MSVGYPGNWETGKSACVRSLRRCKKYHQRTNSLHETGPFAFSRTGSSLPSKPVKARSKARFMLKPVTPLTLKVTPCCRKKDLSPVLGIYCPCGILHQLIGTGSEREETVAAPATQTTVWETSTVDDPGVVSQSSEALLFCPITRYCKPKQHRGPRLTDPQEDA